MSTAPAAEKLAEAKDIVRSLAATPIQVGHPDYALYERCVLCDAWTDDGSDIVHTDTCVWARAKRWAEANPT